VLPLCREHDCFCDFFGRERVNPFDELMRMMPPSYRMDAMQISKTRNEIYLRFDQLNGSLVRVSIR
jgi:hypothetical protein